MTLKEQQSHFRWLLQQIGVAEPRAIGLLQYQAILTLAAIRNTLLLQCLPPTRAELLWWQEAASIGTVEWWTKYYEDQVKKAQTAEAAWTFVAKSRYALTVIKSLQALPVKEPTRST